MDKQQLEWLQCVRDYSDGVVGYGAYVIAGPGLQPIDRHLRQLGYVVSIPNRNCASVITDTGREALAAQDGTHNPAARSAA